MYSYRNTVTTKINQYEKAIFFINLQFEFDYSS
jgi:hypothetical protein